MCLPFLKKKFFFFHLLFVGIKVQLEDHLASLSSHSAESKQTLPTQRSAKNFLNHGNSSFHNSVNSRDSFDVSASSHTLTEHLDYNQSGQKRENANLPAFLHSIRTMDAVEDGDDESLLQSRDGKGAYTAISLPTSTMSLTTGVSIPFLPEDPEALYSHTTRHTNDELYSTRSRTFTEFDSAVIPSTQPLTPIPSTKSFGMVQESSNSEGISHDCAAAKVTTKSTVRRVGSAIMFPVKLATWPACKALNLSSSAIGMVQRGMRVASTVIIGSRAQEVKQSSINSLHSETESDSGSYVSAIAWEKRTCSEEGPNATPIIQKQKQEDQDMKTELDLVMALEEALYEQQRLAEALSQVEWERDTIRRELLVTCAMRMDAEKRANQAEAALRQLLLAKPSISSQTFITQQSTDRSETNEQALPINNSVSVSSQKRENEGHSLSGASQDGVVLGRCSIFTRFTDRFVYAIRRAIDTVLDICSWVVSVVQSLSRRTIWLITRPIVLTYQSTDKLLSLIISIPQSAFILGKNLTYSAIYIAFDGLASIWSLINRLNPLFLVWSLTWKKSRQH